MKSSKVGSSVKTTHVSSGKMHPTAKTGTTMHKSGCSGTGCKC